MVLRYSPFPAIAGPRLRPVHRTQHLLLWSSAVLFGAIAAGAGPTVWRVLLEFGCLYLLAEGGLQTLEEAAGLWQGRQVYAEQRRTRLRKIGERQYFAGLYPWVR